jgi:hypothetical protein
MDGRIAALLNLNEHPAKYTGWDLLGGNCLTGFSNQDLFAWFPDRCVWARVKAELRPKPRLTHRW